MGNPDWEAPPDVDIDTPSAARIYDCLLGGASNFAADRVLADQILKAWPAARNIARANRAFVIRAVRELARQGYNQFIDIGCGLPTMGAVHEVVQAVSRRARVVYVDNELVAVTHAQQILRHGHVTNAGVVNGDVRHLAPIMANPVTTGLIDPTRPVAVVLAAVLHFIPDTDHPAGIMATLADLLPLGSVVVFSHGTPGADIKPSAAVVKLYQQSQNQAVPRTRAQIRALLNNYSLDGPGLTWVTEWYPEPGVRDTTAGPASHMLGAVARVWM